MKALGRFLLALPLLLLLPVVLVLTISAFAVHDLLFALFGRKRLPLNTAVDKRGVSVVIPNWNGRDLLANYLPPVAASGADEIIVVDNGSTDGSAEYLRSAFPQVRVLALPQNLGFGGGSNAGFRAATHDVVVLLNSDMRVAPDFLQPLLDGFTDENVFAVSCQIFFTDPAKHREETGLTQGWWSGGRIRVRHRMAEKIPDAYPCFYVGAGSCAFDRRKVLDLRPFHYPPPPSHPALHL